MISLFFISIIDIKNLKTATIKKLWQFLLIYKNI